MPTRPFTPRQQRENAAFLAALARTGNARLAAQQLSVHRGTYFKRRARDPAFAARWAEALEQSQTALAGTRKGQGACTPQPLVPVRLRDGRVQLRRLRPGTIGPAGEAAFLLALSASANIRLAAAAAGFAHSSFYARKRRDRAFAREMRAALKDGFLRLKAALLQAGLGERDPWHPWRDNDPPPIPPMTPDQALQLLCLHQKAVELNWGQPHRRKRRGESDETYRLRLGAMWMQEQRYEREDSAVRRALESAPATRHPGTPPRHPGLDPGSTFPILPALDQVTGWSKAKPRVPSGAEGPHNPNLALFGGWRLKDWKKKRKGR